MDTALRPQVFSCPFCSKTHSRKFNLDRHIASKHSLPLCENEDKEDPWLFMFLHSVPSDARAINHFCYVAMYLIRKQKTYSFDILWHLFKILDKCQKSHLLFDLFNDEYNYNCFLLFPSFDTESNPCLEYVTALKQVVRHVAALDNQHYHSFLDFAAIQGYRSIECVF